MRTNVEQAYRIYTPLFLSWSIDYKGTQPTQLFKQDGSGDSAYSPNRVITPTVILPVVMAHDKDGIFQEGKVNNLLGDFHWYEDNVEILDTNTNYSIDRSSNMTRGLLTVKKNNTPGSAINLHFIGYIADTRRSENLRIDFYTKIDCVPVALDKYHITADVPSGGFFNPLLLTADSHTLTVTPKAFKGQKGEATNEIAFSLVKIVSGIQAVIAETDFEVISAVAPFQFDLRLIDSYSYCIIGKWNGFIVDQLNFTLKRQYPNYKAHNSGTNEMVAGQNENAWKCYIDSNGAPIANQDRYFSIQPHTVTQKKGDVNWGERSELRINPYDAGFIDGGFVQAYFDVNELKAMKVASADGKVLVNEGKILIV